MSQRAHRHALVVVVLVLAFGGCLTLDPSITANTGESSVFENVSADDSWTGQQVRATASLGSGAGDVTQLTVIGPGGGSISKTTVDPGQTSVAVTLPTTGNATIVASDSVNGTTIETLNLTTSGDTLF